MLWYKPLMKIRPVTLPDRDEWLRMRSLLWPRQVDEHGPELDLYYHGRSVHITACLVLERQTTGLGGFVELNIRSYAEGSLEPRVPYIEGWFVDADLRRRGHGLALIEAAQSWALRQGFQELASDTELDNEVSIRAHLKMGFVEQDRMVCFLKTLK